MSENYLPVGSNETMWSTDVLPTNDNMYEFVTHSYYGSGGYISGDFLVKHDKERNLKRRKKNIFYKNYVKGIVNSLVTPVFSDPAIRSTNNDIFEQFLLNVDLKGNDIQTFTETVLKYVRMHGVCFTIVDMFNDIPLSQKEVIDNRVYPYLIYKTADKVKDDFETDEYGILSSISFEDGCNQEGEELYRLLTREYSVRYIELKDGGKKYIEEPIYHNLGFLPVISTYLDMNDKILPISPIYDICRMNFQIFNLDSEQRNLERLTAFPIFCVQSNDSNVNVNVGADSLLVYGQGMNGSVTSPNWVSPSQDILTVLNTLSNELLSKLIESANTLGASAVQNTYVKSATEVQYEFLGQNFALKKTARIAENFEMMVAKIFGVYLNTEIDYLVKYQDNYRPSQVEINQKVSLLQSLIDMNMSEQINTTLMGELIQDVCGYYKIDADVELLKQSIATTNSVI